MNFIPAEEAYEKVKKERYIASEHFREYMYMLISECINDGRTEFCHCVNHKVSDEALNQVVKELKELHYDVYVEFFPGSRYINISFEPKKKSWIEKFLGE